MASKVIALRGEPIVDEQNTASAAITPGHLIEINAGQWRKHAGAALNAAPIFALERDEMGDDIDTAYASGDRVKAGFFTAGQRVNALIGIGQNITEGDYMESAGDGTLKKLATDAATDDTQRESVVARAAEGSGGAVAAVTRLKVVIV